MDAGRREAVCVEPDGGGPTSSISDGMTRQFPEKFFRRSLGSLRSRNDAQRHAPDTLAISSDATLGIETRARKRKHERLDANAANAGEAIPGLLNDVVFTHVLRSENFDDPADLARLPVVSRAMRDAVAGTGLRFEELGEDEALELGCLCVLKRLQRGGRLSRQEFLCQAAARS